MKNRPLSWIVLGVSLVAWLTQVTREIISVYSTPADIRNGSLDQLLVHACFEILPYAILCFITALISVPKLAYGLLSIALVIVAWIGITELSGVIESGSDMRGLGFVACYFGQIEVAIAAVLLSLIAKALAYFWRRYANA